VSQTAIPQIASRLVSFAPSPTRGGMNFHAIAGKDGRLSSSGTNPADKFRSKSIRRSALVGRGFVASPNSGQRDGLSSRKDKARFGSLLATLPSVGHETFRRH
jgi:hypothetical protein